MHKAANGKEGLEVLEQQNISLAIVDVMMPVMDGITMVLKLREKYDFPVIMLSAKSEDIDKITGLNMGADDYVTKPFVPMELLARVASHLRRYQRFLAMAGGQQARQGPPRYCVGGLELCEETASVTLDGMPVKLTPLEFKILALLIKNPGHVFSADEIYERVWNEKAVNTDTIMVHVRNLREKIELDTKNPKYLKWCGALGTKLKLFDPVRLAATFVCVTLLTALLWTVGTDWSVRQTQRYFDELQQTYGSMAEPGAVLNYAQLYGAEEDTAGNSTAASGDDANWGEQPAFYIPREG